MNFGYVKVATFTPCVKVADVQFNLSEIKKGIDLAQKENVKLLAFPRLALTGCTAEDLFLHKPLIDGAYLALKNIADYTKGKNIIVFVGLPMSINGLVYSVCASVCNGLVLGIVPESCSEKVFNTNDGQNSTIIFDGYSVPFGKDVVFSANGFDNFKVGVEFGENVCRINSSFDNLIKNGARIIVCLASDNEYSKKPQSRLKKITAESERGVCAFVYANAGEGESSTDLVFSGHSVIVENGNVLAEKRPFDKGLNVAEIDLDFLDYQRNKTLLGVNFNNDCVDVAFSVETENNGFTRSYEKTPFINSGEEELLLDIQAEGLKKRISHVNAEKVVLGLSGGLDSALALIVAVRAMKKLNRSSKDVLAITMPCFGTSSRTFENSIKLAKAFNVTLKKIDITKSVKRHLKDIGHTETVHDAAYENAQARERTQVLMDTANMYNGLVVGTGDLSELALGFATYNGDHMSMYAVNGSIPKTLVRHLVNHTAENGKGKLKAVLLDIIDTPVSPELIPSTNDTIKQVTEDIVGPYVLHDYFLYSMIMRGFSPKKIYYTAINTFKGEFDSQTILKWLKTFTRRFFTQQFKRSCMPDGVMATEISLSPRCGFKMPSDAVSKLWLEELENL